MNNFLSLFLVLTTLFTTGIWSPTVEHKTHQQNHKEDVIVKEGHRVIVVEYDKDGQQNTKVSISPPTQTHPTQTQRRFSSEEEEDDSSMKRSSSHSHRPNFEQAGISKHGNKHDLIGDAVRKCTDKLANTFEKGKDQAKECAHHAANVHKRVASDVIAQKNDIANAAGNLYEAAREGTKDSWTKTKEKAGLAKDMGKTFRGDVAGNVSDEVVQSLKRVKTVADWLGNLNTVTGVLHLLGFCCAYGSCMWVTFVSSYLLGGVLPRQQFGMLQTKIYPVYFRVMGYSVLMAILGHILYKRFKIFSTVSEILQGFSLFGSLALVLANALVLEPRATKVMLEKMKVEKEEGRGREVEREESTEQHRTPAAETTQQQQQQRTPESTTEGEATTTTTEEMEMRSRLLRLSKRLGELNSLSSLVNISTLMLLTVHLVYLGQRLNHEALP